MTAESYSIADLARLTGLNVRTIRYYLAQGLLPGSGESGPGAHYGAGHLDRLRLTKRLQAQHLPLAEIRAKLDQLADAEIAELVTEAEPERPDTSALDYIRKLLSPPAPPSPSQYAALGIASAPLAESATPYAAIAPSAPATPAAPGRPSGSGGVMTRLREVATPVANRQLAAPPAPQAPQAPKAPERSQWERLSLGPNIELQVRRPLSRIEQRRVERLITIARQVLNEDQS